MKIIKKEPNTPGTEGTIIFDFSTHANPDKPQALLQLKVMLGSAFHNNGLSETRKKGIPKFLHNNQITLFELEEVATTTFKKNMVLDSVITERIEELKKLCQEFNLQWAGGRKVL